jgi:long-chain acyl-CoA synthetase
LIQENFVKFCERSFKEYWSGPAFSDYIKGSVGRAVTYEEVAKQILMLHYLFKRKKIRKGDKISLIGKNSANWAAVYLAAITYGATIVPILPDFHPEDMQHILHHSDSILLFAADDIYEQLDLAPLGNMEMIFSLSDFRVLYHNKKHDSDLINEAREYVDKHLTELTAENFELPAHIDNSDIAALVYTSGTTGFSKGVMLPYNSLLANVLFAINNMDFYQGDRILSFLPLAHAYGCAFEFLLPFCQGCHITFLSQIPSPRILLQAFQEVKPRFIFTVPLIMEKVYRKQILPVLNKVGVKIASAVPFLQNMIYKKIKQKLTHAFGGQFQMIIIGGAPLNPEVEEFFKKIQLPITVGYGMTECGPLVSYTYWEEHIKHSVGKAIAPYTEVRIDSPDPQKIDGEILIRGENVMQGYYKNKEATREVLTKDGWLHSGDLGVMNEDGTIYIKGRSKNMILGPSGQNIYPEEIESRLNNCRFIQESLVMERNGNIIALVYPDMDAVDEEGIEGSELQDWLKKTMESNRKTLNIELPSYINIAKIELHAEPFEKTPTQKIKRFLYQA